MSSIPDVDSPKNKVWIVFLGPYVSIFLIVRANRASKINAIGPFKVF
jgi:hypothetical protein